MNTKYPGISILYEVGTRADLAQSYGVSERTIYRWLNKAAKESGTQLNPVSKFPGTRKLKNFKGTRKELAAKFSVSERTIYRWLNKARKQGGQIESRLGSKYPGWTFAEEKGTNKELAEKYGVSTRTISRWRKKAKKDKFPEEVKTDAEKFDEEEWKRIQEETTNPEAVEEPKTEEPEQPEEPGYEETSEDEDEFINNIKDIINILLDNEALLNPNSIFTALDVKDQIQYIDFYIQYQYDLDEHQFYNPETHTMDFSADFVTNINIWGDEFEDWVKKQFDSEMYEVTY